MLWCFTFVTFLLLGSGYVNAGINDDKGDNTGLTGEQLFAVILGAVIGIALVMGCIYYLYTRDHGIYDCGSYGPVRRCCSKEHTDQLP
ncbi:uncharacterized protein [Argopecten irradians]|uniref:uncharacterized protein n=1 Tax=Argopecten irradians TaxID=31199 RepID=UPI003714ADF9